MVRFAVLRNVGDAVVFVGYTKSEPDLPDGVQWLLSCHAAELYDRDQRIVGTLQLGDRLVAEDDLHRCYQKAP